MERCLRLFSVIALLAFTCAISSRAQTVTAGSKPDLWSAVPDVDLVAEVNTQRIFVDAIPRLLADQPQMSGTFTRLLEGIKTQTGIDPQAITRIIVGLRSSGKSLEQQEVFGLAEGAFKYSDVLNVVRGEMKDGQVKEEPYAAHSLTIFTPKNAAAATSPSGKIEHRHNRPLALAELGPGMIVFGDPGAVRHSLDTLNSGQNRISPELVSAVGGLANTLVAVAGRVPKELIRKELGDRPNNRLMKMALSVNLVRTRLDLGASSLPFLFSATTDGPEAAGDLRCMLESFRTVLAGGLDFYINPPPGEGATHKQSGPTPSHEVLALRALEGLSITSEGNEAKIQTELPMEVLRSLLKDMSPHSPPPEQAQPDKK